jgi:hypothetical protein
MEQEQECLVQTVEVRHARDVHCATFYVENGIIHARIGDHTLLSPLGDVPAADTVRALLTEHLAQRSRVTNQAERWLSSRWLSHEEPSHGA